MNSESYYSDQSISVLLRALEENLPADRAKWWVDIRACRRRKQIAVDRTMPVHIVFNSQNEYQFMAYKSQVARITMELRERGLLVFDAFRAFNSSNSGLMTCMCIYCVQDADASNDYYYEYQNQYNCMPYTQVYIIVDTCDSC